MGAGAIAGLLLAYTAFLLRHPAIGIDGLSYHLPDIAGWIKGGSPGAVIDYFDDLPTGNYPITSEVLLSWGVGISRSLVALTLWPVAMLALIAVAAVRGLRLLEVPPLATGLTVLALVTAPPIIMQVQGPNTDLPAVAWLVVAAALCAASRRQPALLTAAIVAVGLAVGSKTTPAAPAAAALAAAAFAARGSLRGLVRPLAFASVAALAVGAPWYARDLIDHGSPLWPLVASSFGDPLPFVLPPLDGRLIADLGSVPPRAGDYAGGLGGALALLVAAALAPLLVRRREVAIAAGVAVGCTLVWASAPYTGYPHGSVFDELAVGATRYLMPTVVAAALAIGLAARARGLPGAAALLVLAGAVAWNLQRDVVLGFPYLPSAAVVAAGLAAGALAGLVAGRLPDLPVPPRPATAAATAAAAALLAVPASGYVERHLSIAGFSDASAAWIAARPDFSGGDRPVSGVAGVNGALAGDHLRHRVHLLPRRETCAGLRRRVRTEWVLLPRPFPNPTIVLPPSSVRRMQRLRACMARTPPAFASPRSMVYGPK